MAFLVKLLIASYKPCLDGLDAEYPDDGDFVWNFSFGANMHSDALQKMRGITPMESVRGSVRGWRLNMQCHGIPLVEPAFASIQRSRGSTVHGVAHKMTRKQIAMLKLSEGGGGRTDIDGYQLTPVSVHTYDGRVIEAQALVFCSAGSARALGPEMPLNSSPSCTARYKRLLVEGAKTSGLRPEYVAFLETLPRYEPGRFRAAHAAVVVAVLLSMAPGVLLFLWFKHVLHRRTTFHFVIYQRVLDLVRPAVALLPVAVRGRNDDAAYVALQAAGLRAGGEVYDPTIASPDG